MEVSGATGGGSSLNSQDGRGVGAADQAELAPVSGASGENFAAALAPKAAPDSADDEEAEARAEIKRLKAEAPGRGRPRKVARAFPKGTPGPKRKKKQPPPTEFLGLPQFLARRRYAGIHIYRTRQRKRSGLQTAWTAAVSEPAVPAGLVVVQRGGLLPAPPQH